MSISWSDRIKELEAKGWSLTHLAEEVGLSTSSMSDLKRGESKEPRGMAAVRLHVLHKRECGSSSKEAA